jgi:putative ABC transport system substrate-binding protein
MRRHGFIPLIIAAATTWPLLLSAQQPGTAVVGFLNSGTARALSKEWFAAFHRGLGESGYVDGQNVTIEYRVADNHYDRLPDLAAELVRRQVGVIVAAGGPVSALAAKAATKDIPIVFTTVADPVKSGLVASLNKPGGNITGTAGLTTELDAKRLELLLQLKPRAGVIGVLVNPNRPGVDVQSKDLQAAAHTTGRQLVVEKAGTEPAIDTAFESLARQGIDALLVTADPFFNFRRAQVVANAARHGIPAIYQWREFVTTGGLISYGPSIEDAYHQTGVYAGRILKGAKPVDLPVMQPTRFELVINLKTAKTLGLAMPPTLLARANEVVE